jgi:hypothetical protein
VSHMQIMHFGWISPLAIWRRSADGSLKLPRRIGFLGSSFQRPVRRFMLATWVSLRRPFDPTYNSDGNHVCRFDLEVEHVPFARSSPRGTCSPRPERNPARPRSRCRHLRRETIFCRPRAKVLASFPITRRRSRPAATPDSVSAMERAIFLETNGLGDDRPKAVSRLSARARFRSKKA